jgi:preprotein translocase subunit YajC
MLPALILQAGGNSPVSLLLMPVALMGIMYFLIILPQQRQRKKTQEMLNGLKNGDEVVTTGGIVGTVISMNGEDATLVVRVKPDNVKLRFARQAVVSVVEPEGAESSK